MPQVQIHLIQLIKQAQEHEREAKMKQSQADALAAASNKIG